MTEKHTIKDNEMINQTMYMTLKQAHNDSQVTHRLEGNAATITGNNTPITDALQVMCSVISAYTKVTTASSATCFYTQCCTQIKVSGLSTSPSVAGIPFKLGMGQKEQW